MIVFPAKRFLFLLIIILKDNVLSVLSPKFFDFVGAIRQNRKNMLTFDYQITGGILS